MWARVTWEVSQREISVSMSQSSESTKAQCCYEICYYYYYYYYIIIIIVIYVWCVDACMWMHVWRWEDLGTNSLQVPSLLCWRQCLSLAWNFSKWAQLTASERVAFSCLSPLHRSCDYEWAPPRPGLQLGLTITTGHQENGRFPCYTLERAREIFRWRSTGAQ